MIRKPRTQAEPLDHAQLARLLPAPPVSPLPRDRQLQIEEHLLNEIRTSAPAPAPGRRPRRRALVIGIPATATALAAAFATVLVVDATGAAENSPSTAKVEAPVVHVAAGSTDRLASTVQRIVAAAGARKTPEPGPGQYIYVKSKVSYLASEVNADTDRSKTWVQPLHLREIWKSPDGTKGWLDEPGYQPTGGITLDEDAPVSKPDGEDLTGGGVVHDDYDWLKALPADPDALLDHLYGVGGDEGDRHQKAFEEIQAIVGEQLLPPRTAATLYRAAAKIPGVVVVDGSQDAVGRTGIALARLDERTGERTEMIFDRTTYDYLGSRGVQVEQTGTVKPGTVVERTAVLERAVVDSQRERPGADGAA
ncbi:CU044_5270 family protein [Streptomyces somaliensis]|uniref:CU044_5270 family protein n=2 Tax=Streptomyces somaliensis TaxID=78355 RepID=UPI0020CDD704|nr:CU044_5270 family protein [Streptomyces somaliensis]MCP9944037.1 CU044_5270 family protein [Streptomyces somaliensis]